MSIKDYNKIIMANLSDNAGQYKKVANIILGAEFEPIKTLSSTLCNAGMV